MYEVKQPTVQTQTQQFTILKSDEFKDYEFENNTPLNFRQFIGMVHVNDGMIAITSDSVAYLLKFNYEKVINEHGFTVGVILQMLFGRQIYKAFSNQMSQNNNYLNQFIQILETFLLFYTLTLLIILGSLRWGLVVHTFIKREERGLTKEIDGYLISAVGKAGLDIYKISQSSVEYLTTISFKDFDIFTH